jgi:hypothetical protein
MEAMRQEFLIQLSKKFKNYPKAMLEFLALKNKKKGVDKNKTWHEKMRNRKNFRKSTFHQPF